VAALLSALEDQHGIGRPAPAGLTPSSALARPADPAPMHWSPANRWATGTTSPPLRPLIASLSSRRRSPGQSSPRGADGHTTLTDPDPTS